MYIATSNIAIQWKFMHPPPPPPRKIICNIPVPGENVTQNVCLNYKAVFVHSCIVPAFISLSRMTKQTLLTDMLGMNLLKRVFYWTRNWIDTFSDLWLMSTKAFPVTNNGNFSQMCVHVGCGCPLSTHVPWRQQDVPTHRIIKLSLTVLRSSSFRSYMFAFMCCVFCPGTWCIGLHV